jgi:hypothetical protein
LPFLVSLPRAHGCQSMALVATLTGARV